MDEQLILNISFVATIVAAIFSFIGMTKAIAKGKFLDFIGMLVALFITIALGYMIVRMGVDLGELLVQAKKYALEFEKTLSGIIDNIIKKS